MTTGSVYRVSGPVLEVEGLTPEMLELVEVGEARLPGEVISLRNGRATVQVYAYTGGVARAIPWPPRVIRCAPRSARACSEASSTGCCDVSRAATTLLADGARPGTLDETRRWPFTPRRLRGRGGRGGRRPR